MNRHELYCALTRATTSQRLKFRNIKHDIFKTQGPCEEIKLLREQIKSNDMVGSRITLLLIFI